MKQNKLEGLLIFIGVVIALEFILNLKLLGVSNDILGTLAVVLIPALSFAGMYLSKVIDIHIVPKGKIKRIPMYTFVEVKTDFETKNEPWRMIDLETGEEVRIE